MECPRIAQKRAEISRSRPPGGGAAHFFMGTGTASGDALPKTRPQSRRLVYTGQGREAKTEIPVYHPGRCLTENPG